MRPERSATDEEFPWGALIRSEVETWVPDRLPYHFDPRPARPRTQVRPAWRPLALAIAVVAIGSLVYSLRPTPSAVPDIVRVVLGTTHVVVPQPAQAPNATTVTTAQPVTTSHVTRSGSPSGSTGAGQPQVTVQGAPQAPGQPTGTSTGSAPGGQASGRPTSTPTSGSSSTPAPTPSPTKTCLLGVICL